MNAWLVELIVVRNGSMGVTERRSISRDVERGLLVRVRQGVYVARAAWDAGEGWKRTIARHVIRARAFDAVATDRPVFSHWTAGALQGLPMVDERLERVHVTARSERKRGLDGVSTHVFPLTREEVGRLHGLLVTSVARTVVDVAGAAEFHAGVVIADGVLTAGLPREMLEQAVDLAGPRRAAKRIDDVVAFASPGGESAAESEHRVSMFRLGIEPQELQHEVRDEEGLAGVVDTYDRRRRIGTEVDGERKYLDPELAPDGAGQALVQEKWREDRVRLGLAGLARVGYRQARNPALLRPVLLKVGLLPAPKRPTLADWAAEARTHVPRRRPAQQLRR